MLKMLLVIFLGFLSVTSIFAIIEDQQHISEDVQSEFSTPCTTPNNDEGVCIEVKKCKIFMDAIISRKNDSYDFIRNSQCGSPNEDLLQPKVCCGMYDNYLEKAALFKRLDTPSKSLFPENCGHLNLNSERVFGGIEASLGEFPWISRLRHRRSDGLFTYGCAGFLISEKFVLTAAHCIRSKNLESLGPIYQVQLGEHNTYSDPDCEGWKGYIHFCADTPQLLRTAEPIVHSEYTGDVQHHNDIAIIPLKDPASFTDYVFPICLPNSLSQVAHMWLSGWGKTETRRASPIKLKVQVPRADKVQCTNLYKPIGIKILDSQICAGGESGRDSCTGDSGGPLMIYRNYAWYAEGIVSFGKGCGQKGWPGIYTSIPYYMPWIEMAIKRYLGEQEDEKVDSGKKLAGDYYTWSS